MRWALNVVVVPLYRLLAAKLCTTIIQAASPVSAAISATIGVIVFHSSSAFPGTHNIVGRYSKAFGIQYRISIIGMRKLLLVYAFVGSNFNYWPCSAGVYNFIGRITVFTCGFSTALP
jgi:hypothetical protein